MAYLYTSLTLNANLTYGYRYRAWTTRMDQGVTQVLWLMRKMTVSVSWCFWFLQRDVVIFLFQNFHILEKKSNYEYCNRWIASTDALGIHSRSFGSSFIKTYGVYRRKNKAKSWTEESWCNPLIINLHLNLHEYRLLSYRLPKTIDYLERSWNWISIEKGHCMSSVESGLNIISHSNQPHAGSYHL